MEETRTKLLYVRYVKEDKLIELPEPIEIDINKIVKNEKKTLKYILEIVIKKWGETYKRLSKYEKED